MTPAATRSRLLAGAALLATALVAGCGSVPVRPPPAAAAPAPAPAPDPAPSAAPSAEPPAPREPVTGARPAPPPRQAARPPARAPRGGGYYLDDGPGDSPPPNLGAIPDAVPRAEPLHPAANRRYVVFGREYVPRTDLVTHRERGFASWYGRKFHGRPTSSGERYDMYAMTAAHPTLPIPSYVRVTNVRNGRSVVLRVNDRGPFLNQRVIDLTYTAAWKLGYVDTGSAEVELELLAPRDSARPLQTAVRSDVADDAGGAVAPTPIPIPMLAEAAAQRLSIETTVDDRLAVAVVMPAPAAPADSRAQAPGAPQAVAAPPAGPATWLQLGAFSSRDNAESARARHARELPWLAVPIEVVQGGEVWRVQVGPWTRREDALAAGERIASRGTVRPIAVVR
jgi:rare lipoprotein A